MQKNWLIRTKSNHILGPVSKEKLLELYNNGSVRPDDEICSGNGYWFFLREKDQVEAYLLGNKKQSFNPISEAKDVLTAENRSSVHEVDESSPDVTLVGGIDLSQLNEKPAAKPAPAPQSAPKSSTTMQPRATAQAVAVAVAEPEAIKAEEPEPVAAAPIPLRPKASAPSPTPVAPGKPKKKETEPAASKPLPVAAPKKRLVSDKTLMVGSVITLIILASVLYFRKRILKEFIETTSFSPISSAYAQEEKPVFKKKASLAP